MLIATAGLTVAAVLRPAGITRTPRRTPTFELQLYSIAGARPSASLEPRSNSIAERFRAPREGGTLYPLTRVLAVWRYVTSSARTKLRVRLYSKDAFAKKELPGLAWP